MDSDNNQQDDTTQSELGLDSDIDPDTPENEIHTFVEADNTFLQNSVHSGVLRMDAVWPKPILTRFATIPANPRENDYNIPYNKLLKFLFPVDSPFAVGPQTHPIAESRESIDFTVEYQVFWGDAPVFILVIKTGPKLGLVSAREEADLQIRRRLRDLVGVCPLSKLHAVSAIGTKLCFYTAEDRVITPPRIVADDQFAIDTAPRERWGCDLLEAEGAARLKAVVHEIQQACAQLNPCEHIDSFEMLMTITSLYNEQLNAGYIGLLVQIGVGSIPIFEISEQKRVKISAN